MSSKTLPLIAVLATIVSLLVPTPAMASGNVIVFSGIETFSGSIPNPGVTRFLKNGHMLITGQVIVNNKVTPGHPCMEGKNTITISMDIDMATGSGAGVGTYHIDAVRGGWDGGFVSKLKTTTFYGNFAIYTSYSYAIGYGSGSFKGQVVKAEATGTADNPMSTNVTYQVSGKGACK